MKNYLVTGAAGFIASVVSRMLLESGAAVVGIDNLNDAYDVRMKEHRLKQLQGFSNFHFLKMDISDRSILDLDQLRKRNFDAVINLAARAGVRDSLLDPWVYVDTNATGTLNLLELCKNLKIPKFVLASTSSIYGENAPLPTPETASSDYPLQSYAASKKAAEAMAHAYHYLFDIDVTVVRYFTVYGPAGRPDMVMFRFIKWITESMPLKLNGDGTQTRGFTYVDDIARGTIAALQPLSYEVINLGGHEEMSINELIEEIENLVGQKANIQSNPRHPADVSSNLADVTKAKSILKWQPSVALEEGIASTVEWYQQNRDWARDIQT
jgi:nucleoside-diphosphate-sugar epimerase